MSARQTILDALKEGIGEGRCPRYEGGDKPAFGPDDWALLRERAQTRGARYVGVKDMAEAAQALRGLLEEFGAKSALAWEHPDLDALGLKGLLAEAGVALVGQDAPLAERAAADIGITSVAAVLPEAGSVLVCAGRGTPRQTSLLPPVHVALAPAGRSVPTIEDLPAFVRSRLDADGFPPSAMHLITGPSSTADIEKTVIKGVHGPTVCVILALEG